MLNVKLIITLLFAWLILTLFFSTFTAGLAQYKGRSKKWGILGFLFSVIGLIIVCFLPSKREDNKETNPIKYVMSKMPALSQKTIIVVVCLVLAAITTVVLYDRVPVMLQNRKYEKQVTKENMNKDQPSRIKGGVEKVFATGESTFVLTKTGDVHCFGKQIPVSLDKKGTVIFKGAKKVESTEKVCLVLDTNGVLYGMGSNEFLQLPNVVDEAYEFVQIADHVVDFSLSETTVGFIKEDKKLYMYGDGAHGQRGDWTNYDGSFPVAVLGNVSQVECEATFTVALQQSGEAVVFGANDYGQFALADATVNHPVVVKTNIQKIAAGDGFVLLLDKNGTVFSCGANDCGQLGYKTQTKKDDKSEKEDKPEQAATPEIKQFTEVISGIADIAAGKKSAYAISENGELYAWGQNKVGQLGTKNEKNVTIPKKVAKHVKSVSTSGLHTVIITNSGKVLSTGFNNCGQLGLGQARNEFSELVKFKK